MAELFIENADGLIISPEDTEAVRASVDFALPTRPRSRLFRKPAFRPRVTPFLLADEMKLARLAGRAILAKLHDKARVQYSQALHQCGVGAANGLVYARCFSYRRIETTITCAPDYLSAIEAIRAAEESRP